MVQTERTGMVIDSIRVCAFDAAMPLASASPNPVVPQPELPKPAAPRPSTSQRLLGMVPDSLLAMVFFVLAIDPWIGEPLALYWLDRGFRPLDLSHPTLMAILLVEIGFLLPQVTLTDLATRLKARPPWWLIPPMAIGLLILAPGGMEFLRLLLANQSVLLVPALWSVFHRARQLWDMPGKPALERMRVRALTGGRANIGGLLVVSYLLATMAQSMGFLELHHVQWQDKAITAMAAVYFAICAWDAWRVTGPGFAANPKPLLWWDYIGVKDVDVPL